MFRVAWYQLHLPRKILLVLFHFSWFHMCCCGRFETKRLLHWAQAPFCLKDGSCVPRLCLSYGMYTACPGSSMQCCISPAFTYIAWQML